MKKILMNAALIVLYTAIGVLAYFLSLKFLGLDQRDAMFVGIGAFIIIILVTEVLAHRFHWNHGEPLSATEFLEKTKLTSPRQISQAYKKQGGTENITAILLAQSTASVSE